MGPCFQVRCLLLRCMKLPRADHYCIVIEVALEIVFSHSTILASAITGCIWALWHWPMIIADALEVVPKGSGYSVAETREFHLLYVLAVFTLVLVGSRIIMCWIQGNSSYVIWSSVVYHATHNLYVADSRLALKEMMQC